MGKSARRKQREELATAFSIPVFEEKDRKLALVLRDIIDGIAPGQRTARMTALKTALDAAETNNPE